MDGSTTIYRSHEKLESYNFINQSLKVWICFFLFLTGITQLKADTYKSLVERDHDESIIHLLEKSYLNQYDSALGILKKKLPRDRHAYGYFTGLIYCTMFNDIGDTNALKSAEEILSIVISIKGKDSKPKSDLYKGLSYLQLSYIHSAKGEFISSLLKAKKGLNLLDNSPYLESACTQQIYEYYKQDLLSYISWVPFVSSDKSIPLKFLMKNHHQSRYLSKVFSTPLIWMQFDLGEYQKGLDMTKKFLEEHPENRIFRQMEADFNFKLGNFKKAAEGFEKLKSEYQSYYAAKNCTGCIPINYWSVIGNLVRVYDALGNKVKKMTNHSIWFSKKVQSNEKWLPKSLVKDLDRFAP